MRTLAVVVLSILVSGCGYYLTPRPPVMERKLGMPGSESVGALATAADYRMVYVTIDHPDKNGAVSQGRRLCAEPPPDAAGQFAAQLAAAGKTPFHKGEVTAEMQASMALSMKQLFRRSQGVQFYRDGMFALCNLYLNYAIGPDDYLREARELRMASERLVHHEIPYLGAYTFDQVTVPEYAPGLKKPEDSSGKADPGKEGDAKEDGKDAGDADDGKDASPDDKGG